MVTNATNLSRSGLSDWLIQRFSAVVLAAYILCILGSLALTPDMTFSEWRGLFDSTAMRLFSLLALISLCAHAWIGMWTVGTDYLTERQLGGAATFIRLFYQAVCVLAIVIYMLWGVEIFWGS